MTISLKHAFTSPKTDGGDASQVQPSNWNAEHVLTQATARLLGRTTAGAGATEEIAVAPSARLASGTLSVGLSLIDTQVYTSGSGTWNKPAGAVLVCVQCIGGGGSGGSGATGDGSVNERSGGSGGGGGMVSTVWFNAADLGSTESYVVGAATSSTAGVTGADTNGNNGVNGNPSSFGTTIKVLAIGGPKGFGGFQDGDIRYNDGVGASAPTNTWTDDTYTFERLGGGGYNSAFSAIYRRAGAKGGSPQTMCGSGGGGAGGWQSSTATNAGTAGGSGYNSSGTGYQQSSTYIAVGEGGAAGTAGAGSGGGAGTAGAGASSPWFGSGGGGGGSENASAQNGGAGAAGGAPGGGGGGGGACRENGTSGAGGAGARGEVRVWTYG